MRAIGALFPRPALPRPKAERIDGAEKFFAAFRAALRRGGKQAYYNKAGDYIQMPKFGAKIASLSAAGTPVQLIFPSIRRSFPASFTPPIR